MNKFKSVLLVLGSFFTLNFVGISAQARIGVNPDWNYAESKLKKAGFEKAFINHLKSIYEKKDFETVLKLNLLLFLKKADYHGVQINDSSVKDVKQFYTKNKIALKAAEKKYGVPADVIASLLWMESRHGKVYGKFHVASAYVHLLQTERKEVISFLNKRATDFTSVVSDKQKKEISKRAKKKTNWAIEELKALQAMYKKDKSIVKNLRGSFSGAFGMPQFIPSSYTKWAKSSTKKSANLFVAKDAIPSVGNYLDRHGWKKANSKTYVKSLMKYNNSRDYANAILKLAKLSSPIPTNSKRFPSSGQKLSRAKPKPKKVRLSF